jgi:hypothetical protein
MSEPNALLVLSALIASRTAWTLFVSGSAANNDRSFTRNGSPRVYWITIMFGCVAVVICVSTSIWLRVAN